MFPLTEVGYLAVHIGGSLFRGRYGKDRRKKVALVCTTGMGTSLLLLAKINDIFREQLDLTGTFTMRQATTLRPRDADLILSTCSFPRKSACPGSTSRRCLPNRTFAPFNGSSKRDGEPVPIRALFQPSLFFDHLPPHEPAGGFGRLVEPVVARRLRGRNGARLVLAARTTRHDGNRQFAGGAALHGGDGCSSGDRGRGAGKPIVWEYGMVQVVLMIAVSKEFLKKENGFFLRLYQRLNTTMKIKEFINTRHLDLLMDAFNEEDIL